MRVSAMTIESLKWYDRELTRFAGLDGCLMFAKLCRYMLRELDAVVFWNGSLAGELVKRSS